MEVKTPHLSSSDIFAILICTSSNKVRISIPAVLHRLKASCAIDSEEHDRLLDYFGDPPKTDKESKRNFHCFIRSIASHVPFFTFCEALKQAGYCELSHQFLDTRLSKPGLFVSRGVMEIDLPDEEELHLYYVKKKSKIDNNKYKNHARDKFRDKIDSLKEQLKKGLNNNEDTNALQFIVNKICILYFLLSQQYASPPDVTEVLMEMREVIPHNTDRTFFDTIFHSYMAFNCASCGDTERAESHLKTATAVSSHCANGFVRILAAQWCQYVNNTLYWKSQGKEKSLIDRAKVCFNIIQQCLQDVNDGDERHIWKTISVLDMARVTVGITPRLEMCDIENIDDANIAQAKAMIEYLKEPKGIRRKMFYHIVFARVHEKVDRDAAMSHITVALELAPDGCYDELGREKIINYSRKLRGDRQPQPSI